MVRFWSALVVVVLIVTVLGRSGRCLLGRRGLGRHGRRLRSLLGSYSLVGIGKFNLLYIPVAYWGSNAGFEKQGFGVPYFNTFWGPVT